MLTAASGDQDSNEGGGVSGFEWGDGGDVGWAWQAGAVGAVPRLGAAAPQACCEVYQAWKDGDLGLAEEKQLSGFGRRRSGWKGRVESAWSKYGCDLNGYFGGRPRLPLLALNGARREELERVMMGLKN